MQYNHTISKDFSLRCLAMIIFTICCVASVSAITEKITMQVGETRTLQLPNSILNAYPNCKGTAWLSYGSEYVRITSQSKYSATIMAVKAFSSPIIIRCDYYYYTYVGNYGYGGTTYCDYQVTVNSLQPTSISLYPSKLTLSISDNRLLEPTLTPSNASTEFSWRSSNSDVVYVNSSGHVTAQDYGSAIITCTTSNGLSATCTVSVPRLEPTTVSLPSALSLEVGNSSDLTPKITPSSASTSYTWKSSDTTVVTVTSSGKVTGIGAGEATITVNTANNLS